MLTLIGSDRWQYENVGERCSEIMFNGFGESRREEQKKNFNRLDRSELPSLYYAYSFQGKNIVKM
jgi:hypothetical protein